MIEAQDDLHRPLAAVADVAHPPEEHVRHGHAPLVLLTLPRAQENPLSALVVVAEVEPGLRVLSDRVL